jgi:hypothetical protein
VSLTGTYPLTAPPGESESRLRFTSSFPIPVGLNELPLEVDLLDAKGQPLFQRQQEVALSRMAVVASAPTVLPRDGNWRNVDFDVVNASTVAEPDVHLSATQTCTLGIDSPDCAKSAGSTTGLRVQWSSPDGWRDVPASGIDLPSESVPVGATHTVHFRVAATAQLDKTAQIQVGLDLTVPGDIELAGTGDVAKMTVS